MGLVPLSAAASVVEAPRSRSSQQYVSVSPFPSEPDAVRVNGVNRGIVKSDPALTVGTELPVADSVAQVVVVLNRATISSREMWTK